MEAQETTQRGFTLGERGAFVQVALTERGDEARMEVADIPNLLDPSEGSGGDL